MAYDKVVDSSVLDAGLKQIANAIREKGGTSDNLAFPQAMADAIAAIEAGGGGGSSGSGAQFVSGTFTKTGLSLVRQHSLGSLSDIGLRSDPNFYACVALNPAGITNTGTLILIQSKGYAAYIRKYNETEYITKETQSADFRTPISSSNKTTCVISDSNVVTVRSDSSFVSSAFASGAEYLWILGVI